MSTDEPHLLGYRIYSGSPEMLAASILRSIEAGDRGRSAVCLNPHSYVLASRRESFASALTDADWILPDGIGILLASKFLGGRVRRRITGSDIFHLVNGKLQSLGRARVFLLGSTEETLTGIVNRMTKEWPAIRVVGTYAPPFRPGFTDDDIEAMVGRINSAEPDVLWVGITAPKQEELLWRLRGRLNVRFAAAIGGAFDFYVGNIPRAGTAFRRIGLEWLPRLLREPRRLWRRSFVSAPIFLMHVIRQRIVPERMRH